MTLTKTLKSKTGKKIYKAGIAGCGRIASSFDLDPLRRYVATHAGAYTKFPKTQLAAACDIDPEKLKAFGAFWKVKRLYQNLEEMLAKEELDILSICTWSETHDELAKLALRHGVKAIFCEKPVTNQLDKADELVEACRRAGVVLAVNHSRRWDTGHQKIKQFLDQGKLGLIHQVNCYYTAGLSNTGTHLFDLLRFFLGEAQWVDASPQPVFGDKDPTVSGQILFENGVLVSLAGLDVKDYLIFEIDFYGSKGRLRVTHSGFDLDYWKVGKSSYFSGYKELVPAKAKIPMKEKQMMVNAVADLVASLEKEKESLCTGEDGRKALEIACAFRESLKSGGRISLPLQNRNVGI